MKIKSFLLVVALVTGMAVNAQENTMWVGGSVGFWSQKTKGADSQMSYKFAPEFGYILNDQMAVGINIGFVHTEETSKVNTLSGYQLTNYDGFVVAPFLRYTAIKAGAANIFVDAGVSYTQLKPDGDGDKTNLFDVGFKPGVTFKLGKNLGITTKIGFLGYQNIDDEGTKTNGFGLDLDLDNIEFGFSYSF